MLVATRDPVPPRGDQHDAALQAAAHRGSRMGRLMLMLQLAGSVLAIPVGLASGYSIYRANFSPETTCQTLRGNIVAMIDKQIDASTRRMLVRKDVEEFEKSCGSVDPDAEAAFKALLTSASPAPAATPARSASDTVQPLALPANQWKQAEPHPLAKQRETKETRDSRDVKEPAREARAQPADQVNDARWLDAVRHALTAHERERAAAEATVKPLVAPATLQHAVPVTAAPAGLAPALPPATNLDVAPTPKPAPSEADHPIPPASIPDAPAKADPVRTGSVPEHTSWIDRLPLIGR